MDKGKNFSRNRPRADRSEADFYQTPHCLTDEFMKAHVLGRWPEDSQIADLCYGGGAIPRVIEKYQYGIYAKDIKMGCDFFTIWVDPPCGDNAFEYGIMNPPFRLFNKWVEHCFKIFSVEFALLAPTTYLQGICRFNKVGTGIFQNSEWPLKYVYTFNRYPMLSREIRHDGLITTGMQSLSWFVWTRYPGGGEHIDTIHRWLDIDAFVLRKGRKRE
ncbi:hypothetical protein AGMMS50268_16880 [Spirochaetia bacterium]|nr:hypothetical protein AGMMS50268_16880 [Spirochaetia bacterium]